jgi:hypothetical protein
MSAESRSTYSDPIAANVKARERLRNLFNPILHGVITGILGTVIRIARNELSDRNAAATQLLNAVHMARIDLAFDHCFHAYMNRFDVVRDNRN